MLHTSTSARRAPLFVVLALAAMLLVPVSANAALAGANPEVASLTPNLRSVTLTAVDTTNVTTTVTFCFDNPIGSLLMDIWFLFARAEADKLFSRTLVAGLNECQNRPWAELIRVRTARAPQGVTDLWLSQKLRPYGVRPTMLRIGDDLGRGYTHVDFEEVFRRYIPRPEVEALKLELSVRRSRAPGAPIA